MKKEKKHKDKKKKEKKREKPKKPNFDVILVAGLILIFIIFFVQTFYMGLKKSDVITVKKVKDEKNASEMTYRMPVVAGSFYEADSEKLRDNIKKYLGDAKKYPEIYGVKALVSPHAGYIYSGPTAAYGYKQLIGSRYETVIVLGPSHRHYFKGASVADVDYYHTPLGDVRVSPKAKQMLSEDVFSYVPAAHTQEHSVEVQIPFLQQVLPPFELVPIVVGDVSPTKLADALEKYVDDNTLLVASSDLSHYKDYLTCKKIDERTVSYILDLDVEGMTSGGDACGRIPAAAVMEIAKRRGWRTKLFDQRNSGDTAGDKKSVVGYASIGFYDGLDADEQEKLLDIAQKTIEASFKGQRYDVDESSLSPKLLEKKAAFVTLNKNHQLRGCIGHLTPQMSLYESVMENALSAAYNDPRFEKVTQDEFKNIKIEVSVLTQPAVLNYDSPDDLLEKLIPGVDGLIIKRGIRQSTYLPVVWEQIPDKEDFLSNLCRKGGNSIDCWKQEGTQIYTYQAQEFHQKGFK